MLKPRITAPQGSRSHCEAHFFCAARTKAVRGIRRGRGRRRRLAAPQTAEVERLRRKTGKPPRRGAKTNGDRPFGSRGGRRTAPVSETCSQATHGHASKRLKRSASRRWPGGAQSGRRKVVAVGQDELRKTEVPGALLGRTTKGSTSSPCRNWDLAERLRHSRPARRLRPRPGRAFFVAEGHGAHSLHARGHGHPSSRPATSPTSRVTTRDAHNPVHGQGKIILRLWPQLPKFRDKTPVSTMAEKTTSLALNPPTS